MEDRAEPTLVVYGAGNIGRGIVSLLFLQAGYRLQFYRRNVQALLEMQTKGGYVIHSQSPARTMGMTTPVREFEVLTGERALIQALADTDLMACCIYPTAFQDAARILACAVCHRAKVGIGQPLNVLLCCNEPMGSGQLQALLQSELDRLGCPALTAQVGIVPVAVYSVGFHPETGGPYDVAVSEHGYLDGDKAAFLGEPVRIPGLHWVDGVEARLYRKLYLGNLFHTLAAVYGAEKGYQRIGQCYGDRKIRTQITAAFAESEAAVLRTWHFDEKEHRQWREMMLRKMQVPSQDEVDRVIRDLRRKLGREERLIGPILLCLQQNLPSFDLVVGAAAALSRLAQEQTDFAEAFAGNPADAVAQVCGLKKSEPTEKRLLEQIVRHMQCRLDEKNG